MRCRRILSRSMLYKHFHDHIKKSRGEAGIPADPKDWPQEWKTVYFKEYPRFPKTKLVLPKAKPCFNLFRSLAERKSGREFSGKPVNLKDLSQLLIYGAGISQKIKKQKSKIKNWDLTRRVYPSGGGRYPVELYMLIIKPAKDLEAGIYHFNAKANLLERLPGENTDISKLLIGDWSDASAVVIMSAVFDRAVNKYGDFGYRLIWAECGHIGQNFYLLSQALGLKCCACAGVNEDYANELLGLDGEDESVLIAYVFGS